MTTQAYIPTEEELKEMGFGIGNYGFAFITVQDVNIYYHARENHRFTIQTMNETPIYPRDKAHLQSIILAFQPQ